MTENMKKRMAIFLSIMLVLPTIILALPMASTEVSAASSYVLMENVISPNPIFGTKGVEEAKIEVGTKVNFGDFVDVNQITHREKLENFVLPPLGDARGRLVYCFYPDKTVGLDSCYLQSVGRVPYTGRDGTPKSFDAIRHDILVQLVLDYQRAISK